MARDFLVWVTPDFEGFPYESYDALELIERVHVMDNGDKCIRVCTVRDVPEEALFALLYGCVGVYMVHERTDTTRPDWMHHWSESETREFWQVRESLHQMRLAGAVME